MRRGPLPHRRVQPPPPRSATPPSQASVTAAEWGGDAAHCGVMSTSCRERPGTALSASPQAGRSRSASLSPPQWAASLALPTQHDRSLVAGRGHVSSSQGCLSAFGSPPKPHRALRLAIQSPQAFVINNPHSSVHTHPAVFDE